MNNYAVSSDGIATALQDSASALMEAGNNLEQSVALVAAANKVVQDPNSVGSALRTISLRLRGTSVEVLEAMGEETDNVVESTSKLQEKLEALTGVDILTDAGAYKDTYTILKEIGSVWQNLDPMDQAAALELMAGKNRANTLAAILNNMNDLTKAYESALDAEGSALRENEAYLDSIQGRIDLFTNALQTMWMNLLSSDLIKSVVDAGTLLIKTIDGVRSAIGTIPTVVLSVAALNFAKTLIRWASATFEVVAAETTLAMAEKAVAEAKNKSALMSAKKAVAQAQESLTTAENTKRNLENAMSLEGMGTTLKNITKTPIGKIGIILTAISLVIGLFSKLKQTEQEAVEAAKQSADSIAELNNSLSSYQATLRSLRDELDSGNLSEQEAYDVRKQLISIQDELISKYGKEAEGINLVTGTVEDQIDAINRLSQANAERWLNENSRRNTFLGIPVDSAIGQAIEQMETTYNTYDAWGTLIWNEAFKNIYDDDWQKYSEDAAQEYKAFVESLGGELDTSSNSIHFQDITREQLDDYYTQIQNWLREAGTRYGVDFNNLIGNIENSKQDKLGDDYATHKANYDAYLENTAIASYTEAYGKILDSEDEFLKASTDDKRLSAIGEYKTSVEEAFKEAGGNIDVNGNWNIAQNVGNASMQQYFKNMHNQFANEEFEINVKLNEDNFRTNLQNIVNENGAKGLSALDDVAIKDMVSRGLNIEGATDTSGKYTQEQIAGLIKLQAEANNAGVSIETLINTMVDFGVIAGLPAEKAESIEAVGQAYSTLASKAEEFSSINEILNETVYDNIEMSEEQYESLKDLIGSEEEFADCVDTTNGYIVTNTSLLKKLVAAKKKELAADAKLVKSQARLEYYDLVKQLNNTLNVTGDLNNETREAIYTTLEQIDVVNNAIYKYQLLEDQLLGVNNAFKEFEEAKEVDALNTYGDSYTEMVQTMYDALYKTGQVGTEQFWTAVESLIPDSVYQGLTEDADKIEAIYKYFNKKVIPSGKLDEDTFSLDYDSVENFVDEALDVGIFTGNREKFNLVEGMNLEEAARLLGITKTQAYALFAELDKYNVSENEPSFLSQLDGSLEGRITNITNDVEKLNKQKFALLEDGGYEKNKTQIDEINKKIAQSQTELGILGQQAYNAWQEYTATDAAIEALGQIEDKQSKLTKETANQLGIEWNEEKELTVQEAYDQLLAKQLQLEQPTILTAQLAIKNIDAQISDLQSKLENQESLDAYIEANPDIGSVSEAKEAIEAEITKLKEDKAAMSVEFGIELTEEEKADIQTELDAIEKFVINDKEFTVVANGTSETMQKLQEVDRYAKDVTKTVMTVYQETRTHGGGGGSYTTKYANGTAHANETAFAGGSWGAQKTETALTGELGPELVVRGNKWFTVGDNGAEFVKIKKNDIVFNHKQTESLFKNGYVTGRGKAYASGTAYSGLWKPTSPDSSLSNEPGNDFSSAASSLSNAADNISDAADEFEEVFDWIEVRLEEINEDLDLKNAQLENKIGSSSKNAVIDSMISINKQLYDNLQAGADEYNKYAKALLSKVPAAYRDAAQNGAIAIEQFVGEVDEKTLNAIQDYREWAQKGADAAQQAEEVLTEISALAKQAIDNIADDYGNKISVKDSIIDQLDAYNALTETKFGSESENIYKQIIDVTNKNIKLLQDQRNKMQAELNAQVEAGNIKKYSQDWYDAIGDISALDTEIIELTTDVYNYQDAINELHWEHFDVLMSQFEAISDEADNLLDILDSKDLVDKDTAEWTKEGITSLGLLAQKMEVAEVEAKKYKDEINYLNKNWKKLGYTEQEYIEKLEELKSGQYDAIKAYNDTKDAIVDLNQERIDAIKEGIDKEIEAYEELIEKKKEELDTEKDLYDFQKGVMDQQKNIADLQRQLAAISMDNSSSARAKRAQLEAELYEARQALEETYYDRSIENQQTALDKELENFQDEKEKEKEGWDLYLEDTEQVVADSLATIQSNTDTVYQTLQAMGQEYSLSIAEALKSPWEEGAYAIQSFSAQFGISMSATVEELQKLAAEYKEVMADIEGYGEKVVNEVDSNTNKYQAAEKKDPPKKEESKPKEESKKEDPKPSLTKGSYVEVKKGTKWYSTSNGGGKWGYAKAGKIKYINTKGSHAYNIDGLGWVKKTDIVGYAKGTQGVNKDQLAWIDEMGLEELVMHAGPDGRLQYLSKGTSVIPADITSNLMQWGDLDPTMMLDQNRPQIGIHPEIHNTEINLNITYGDMVSIGEFHGESPEDIAKLVSKQFEKHTKDLNNALKKFVR